MKRLKLLAYGLLISLIPYEAGAELGGVTISPPLKQVVLSTSVPTTVSFSVTNNSDSLQTYQLQAVDFKALSESGGVAFLGQDVTDQKKYGLAKWLRLDNPQISLQPKETKNINAAIPPDISPGGHYCAILLTSPNLNSQAEGKNINLQQVSSALVFAIKSGGANYSIRLENVVGLERWMLDSPQKLRLRFYNSGNVQAIPRGTIEITDPLGKVVSKGIINSETGMVLPESFRQYPVPMDSINRAWLPGNYQIKATYRHEGTEELQTFARTIYIINWVAIWGIIAVIILISGIVVLIWKRRRKGIS